MLNIAICDDEMLDLETESEILKEVLTDQNLNFNIDTFSDPCELMKVSYKYNIIILDVEMEKMRGIEAAERIHLQNKNCRIFFVTHHEFYMDEALNKHAFRFWTKPIDRERLIFGIKSAIDESAKQSRVIIANVNKKKREFKMKNIIYIHHTNRKTYIITTNGEYKTNDTLKTIIKQLDLRYFGESHASCYVNFNYVVDYSKEEVVCRYMENEYKPIMSRRKYKDFDKNFWEWGANLR